MSVNEERSALDMDTVNLECHAQQHSILNNIENIFFFFSDLSGKELDLACLFFFYFAFCFSCEMNKSPILVFFHP